MAKLVAWIKSVLASLAFGLVTALVTAGGLAWSENKKLAWAFFVAALISAVTGLILRQATESETKTLKRDLATMTDSERVARQETQSVLDRNATYSGHLREIADSLAVDCLAMLSLRMRLGKNERVTLYRREGDAWAWAGRYSTDMVLGRQSRTLLSGDCIVERAFRQERYFIASLPDPETQAYVDEQKDLGLNSTRARKLRMKSRAYFALGFGPADRRGRDCVVVIESLDPNGLDEEFLVQSLDRETCRLIRTIVQLRCSIETIGPLVSYGPLGVSPLADTTIGG